MPQPLAYQHAAWLTGEVTIRAQKGATAETDGEKPSLLELLLQNVLKNPYIWGMALTYFCIYVVRQGVTSWFVFYLMKVRSLGRLCSFPPCDAESGAGQTISQSVLTCTCSLRSEVVQRGVRRRRRVCLRGHSDGIRW